MESRHVSVYRLLLRVYPRRFQAEYRDEMTRLFADRLRDVRANEGPGGVARLWAECLVDLIVTAPGQHLAKEVLVASPAGVPDESTVVQRDPLGRLWFGVALVPFWFALLLVLIAPGFMEPLFTVPPAILGFPAGLMVLGAAFAWMAIGVAIVASTTSFALRIIGLLAFAVPATVLVILAPAGILIIQNVVAAG